MPLSSARQNKESEKDLFNTNKQKTNTRTYNVCTCKSERCFEKQGIKQLLNIP